MTIYNVPGTGFAELIVNAGDGPTMVINRDETIQLYVGDDNSVASKNGTGNIDIIDPLSYIVYDGISSKYAIAAVPGSTITIDCVKGATNWAPSPAQAAAQISLLGLATSANQNTQITHESTTATQLTAGIGGTPLAKTGDVNGISAQAWAANSGLAKESGGNLANLPLLGTGIALPVGAAKESGGNLTIAANALNGTVPSALVSTAGITVAKDMLNAHSGVTSEIAALIGTGSPSGSPGGVPLTNLHNSLLNQNSTTLAPLTSTSTSVTFTQVGYEFIISLRMPAATTVPWIEVQLIWSDSATGLVLWMDNMKLPAGNSSLGPNEFIGRGPAIGDTLQIQIGNADPAQTLTYFYSIFQISQNVAGYSTMRSNMPSGVGFSVPGYTVPDFYDPAALILGARNPNIAAGATDNTLLPMHKGKARFYADTSSGAADLQVLLFVEGIGVGSQRLLEQISNNQGFLGPTEIVLPGYPVQVGLTNNNAAAKTLRYMMMIEEY